MGVMSCSRRRCTNVMCHTHIDDIGYICYDCQKEFKEWLERGNITPTTSYKIFEHLKNFMEIEKIQFENEEIGVDEFFRQNIRS